MSEHQLAVSLGEMDDSSLPTDTMLDGPERDPEIDDEVAALLKTIYLAQPRIATFRRRGMTNTQIVNAMHALVQVCHCRELSTITLGRFLYKLE
jgi:hypothetical protein